MRKEYWDGEWPNLNNLKILIPLDKFDITHPDVALCYWATCSLYRAIAGRAVHSAYSVLEKDPKLENTSLVLARHINVSARKFNRIFPDIIKHFDVTEKHIRIKNWDWVLITKDGLRRSIPNETRQTVLEREGRRCAYCGDKEGPFDFDHLFPVSKGGLNSDSNIVLACVPCNRSKGAKTLKEWMDWRASQ